MLTSLPSPRPRSDHDDEDDQYWTSDVSDTPAPSLQEHQLLAHHQDERGYGDGPAPNCPRCALVGALSVCLKQEQAQSRIAWHMPIEVHRGDIDMEDMCSPDIVVWCNDTDWW